MALIELFQLLRVLLATPELLRNNSHVAQQLTCCPSIASSCRLLQKLHCDSIVAQQLKQGAAKCRMLLQTGIVAKKCANFWGRTDLTNLAQFPPGCLSWCCHLMHLLHIIAKVAWGFSCCATLHSMGGLLHLMHMLHGLHCNSIVAQQLH